MVLSSVMLGVVALGLGSLAAVAVLRRGGGWLPWAAAAAAALGALVMPPCPIDEFGHYAVASFARVHGRLATLHDHSDPSILALYEGRHPSPARETAAGLGEFNLFGRQYEAVQPPAAYALWWVLTSLVTTDAALGLVVARLTGALALAVAAAATWAALGGGRRGRTLPSLVVAVLFVSPATVALCSYANNAPLAMALMAVVALLVATGPPPRSWGASRSLLTGSVAALAALTHWYCVVAVGLVALWLAAVLPPRRLAAAAAPLALAGAAEIARNRVLYGSITGLALHREIVSHSFTCSDAELANLPGALRHLAHTLILPEFFGLSWRPAVAAAGLAGLALLAAGVLALVAALGALRRGGLAVLQGPGRGLVVGALVWNLTVLLVVALPLVTGGGAILGRYLAPVLPFLALGLQGLLETRMRPGPTFRVLLVGALMIGLAGGLVHGLVWWAWYDGFADVLAGRVPPTATVDLGLATEGNRFLPGGLVRDGQVVQSFTCPVDEVAGVRVLLCTFRVPAVSARYEFVLRDGVSGGDLAVVPLVASRMRDWGWYSVEFPPLRGLRGRRLEHRIRPRGSVDTPVTLQFCTPPGPGFACLVDGEPHAGCVVFDLLVPRTRDAAALAGRLLGCRPVAARVSP